jgi:hypothetical protein
MEIEAALAAESSEDVTASPHEMENSPFEFDSMKYGITGFHKDSLIVTISNWDSCALYTLSSMGSNRPITSPKFKALRGDVISVDANTDGYNEQSSNLLHTWMRMEATFDQQYGPGRAFCRVYVYSFISNRISSTFTSNIPWGDYYVIRKGVRYSFGIISGGGWCNGTTCPFVKGYVEDGDIIGLDVNRDGIPEQEIIVTDPNNA